MGVKSLNNYFIKHRKKDNLFGSLKKEGRKNINENKKYFVTLVVEVPSWAEERRCVPAFFPYFTR